jgi:hypothetical protein
MEFRILPIRNKELFLRYAIPCGEVLVKRGELKMELLEKLRDNTSHGQEVDVDLGAVFGVAARMCTIIARRMGKSAIDDEVIRRYFLVEHDRAIEWRRLVKPDIDARECRVYPGKVLKIDDSGALVRTPIGDRALRTDLAGGLRKGERVSTHYNYVSEKISASQQSLLSGRKKPA